MTYCLAIKVRQGLLFAADSRTSAGVDYVSVYRKVHSFGKPGERQFVLLSAGNLATTQAVLNEVQRDLDDDAEVSLDKVSHVFDAAHYVGQLSARIQAKYAEALEQNGSVSGASFILGGQIKGRPHDIFLIYPEGNYICASPETPYLQIGENKYGKPILDRLVHIGMSLEDAARCACISLDSTMRSNLSVGPPLELILYRNESLEPGRHLILKTSSPDYASIRKSWKEGVEQAFTALPRFDWE
ncbi:MAG: peptidase [Leptospirillia bacterium]